MISFEKDNIEYQIYFIDYVGNDEWRINFGLHQKELTQNKSIQKLYLNFEKCKHVEPLVLLSIAITVHKYKNAQNDVCVILPQNTKTYTDFLRFFLRSGFLNIFKKENVQILIKSAKQYLPYNDIIENHIIKIQDVLQNVEGPLYPATILDMNDADFNEEISINKQVAQIVDAINLNQYNLNYYQQKQLKNNIFQILIESLENVKQHAYPISEPKKTLGLYIRYRCDDNTSALTPEQRRNIKDKKNAENKATKLLDNYIQTQEGFIEIFVIDSGMGIIGSMQDADLVNKIKYKSPFAGLFYMTFYEGKRANRKHHKTTFGGLYMLNRVLKKNNDFIYAAENNTVVATYSNIKDNDYNKYVHRFVQNTVNEDNIVSGLSMIFRLNVNSEKINTLNDNVFISDELIIDALKESQDDTKTQIAKSYFKDYRGCNILNDTIPNTLFKKNNLFLLPSDKLSKDNIVNMIEDYCIEYKISVYLSDNDIKNNFFSHIEEVNQSLFKKLKKHKTEPLYKLIEFIMCNKDIKNVCLNEIESFLQMKGIEYKLAGKSLYIVDIPSHSVSLYLLAINNALNYNLSITLKLIDYIYIMTNNYELVSFKLDIDKFRNDIDPETIRRNYIFCIRALRYHDSLLFWKILFNEQNKSHIEYLLKANIKWRCESEGDSNDITHYLNFENVLHNEKLTKILSNCILRLKGLYIDKNIEFVPTDKVVKKLLERVNVISKINTEKEMEQIRINSVYLTGLTFNNSNKNHITERAINIFAHPMSHSRNTSDLEENSSTQTCLLLWPNDKWSEKFIPNNGETFYRVGQTHMVSKEKDLHIIYQSHQNYYECDLKDTYLKFQTQYPPFIRVGHYNYKHNHELINVNFNNIFDETTSMGAEIFNYVLCNIVVMLNIIDDDKSFEQYPKEYRGVLQEYYKKYNHSHNVIDNVAFVVYPSHYYTDNIINKIRSILPENYRHKLIAISYSKHGNNMSTISPDSINRLNTIISSIDEKEGNVLFFDTIISSGYTRRIIKNYLLSAECSKIFNTKEIKNLIVIDARRMPYPAKQLNKNNFYMRMDIPRLGNDKSCVLCNALHLIKELFYKLKNTKYSQRVIYWINKWSESSVMNIHEEKFLSDKPINKYSRKSTTNPPILNTTGLLLHSLESHSLYARDDILFELLEEYEDELTSHDVVLLICSKLFLFGSYDSLNSQIKIIQYLIKNIIKIDPNESIACLGFITLMVQDTYSMEETIERMITDNSNFVGNISDDIKIVLSYFSNLSEKMFLLLPNDITRIFDSFDRIDAYEYIHSLVCNDCGYLHDTELMKYVKKGCKHPNNYIKRYLECAPY